MVMRGLELEETGRLPGVHGTGDKVNRGQPGIYFAVGAWSFPSGVCGWAGTAAGSLEHGGQRLNRRLAGSYSCRGESARKTQRWHVKPGGRWSCRVAFVIIRSPHRALRTPGGWSPSGSSRCAW